MSDLPPETYAGLMSRPPACLLDSTSDEDDRISISSNEDGDRPSLLRQLLDINDFIGDAAAAIVNDSFSRCFQSQPVQSWNWNPYLFVFSALGTLAKEGLFLFKFLILIGSFLIFFIAFGSVTAFFHAKWKLWDRTRTMSVVDAARLKGIQSWLVMFVCCGILFSWFAAIKYHGVLPVAAKNHIWVANHTSMIDYAVVCAATPFASVMQYHPGWMGWIQEHIMGCIDCVFFNRGKKEEASEAMKKMEAHMKKDDARPLLIFPEGTCVNNEYCVMFKSGAFKLGATVCPIAIKYNKSFVDPFWNSRKEGFMTHLFSVMRAWTVPAEVHFMEPQNINPGESPEDFANRVRLMIATRAGLKVVDWDGMLKYKGVSMKDPHRLRYNKKAKAYPAGIRRALGRPVEELVQEMRERELALQLLRKPQEKVACDVTQQITACDVPQEKCCIKGITSLNIHAEASSEGPGTPPAQGGAPGGLHWRQHED